MRWMVVVCVAVIGVGCARAHQELVAVPATPDGMMELDPAIEQRLLEERLQDHVDAAKRMLNDGDLATAAILLGQALQLDPTSKTAITLQKRLETAQRRVEEKARRELISLYEREGLEILKQGDDDRALTYFHAAQALDPANRKIFKRIQQANATWHQRRAQQREVEFESGKTIENGVAVLGASGTSAGASQSAAQASLSTKASPPIPQIVPSGEAAGYTVQPGDVLQVTAYEEPALTTKARVASSGEIMFPLLGRVAVVGLTVPQVQEKLTSLLGEDYLVNPQLQVSIESYQARNVFITGAVNRPGSYPMPAEKPTTLLEAIAMAGGFSDDASLNGTRVIRIEDGQDRTITVRAGDIIKKGDKTKDVSLRPNDVIFVPESFF